MPVTISDGRMIGTVRDVGFGQETGAVRSLTISEGVANDVAVGRTTVEGDSVVGFSGGSVVVMEKTYRSTRVSGGAARVAATGVTVAKVRGEQLLKQADAALEASGVKQKVAEAPEKVGRGLGKLYRRARGAAEKAVDAYERDE
jgi:uncharacterized protein YrrD